jgi:hypothetical protein
MTAPDVSAPARHRAGDHARGAGSSRVRRLVLLSMAAGIALTGVLSGWSMPAGGPPESTDHREPAGGRSVVLAGVTEPHRADRALGTVAAEDLRRARNVLRAWDQKRAAAYALGSVAQLRDLYVEAAAAADVRVLRSYLRRGYLVEDMRMQLLDVRVLARRPGEWRLEVTDRLAGAVAVGHGERLVLPRDRASTRTVVLRHGADGQWRAAAVRG